MDIRAAKLANARKKLRDHQEKKSVCPQKDEELDTLLACDTLIDVSSKHQTQLPKDEPSLLNYYPNDIQVDKEEIMTNHFVGQPLNEGPVQSDEKCYTNVTEILISNKTNLELQIKELQIKISDLEHVYSKEVYEHNLNKQKLSALELELNDACKKHTLLMESISKQDSIITELQNLTKTLTDDNNNLKEQKEFTQTILTAKEMEAAQLNSQIGVLQNQLDVMSLQLQQLTSDTNISLNQESNNKETNESMMKKVTMLEHQLESSLKEKDHINSHYEHYVSKLNEQLKQQVMKNESLIAEVTALQSRESALIEQIGQMEIRMQNYRRQTEMYAESYNITYIQELTDKVSGLQVELDELSNRHKELQKEHEESLNIIKELNETKTQELCHENISISKLNADITSDKVAAQRATEQNKKLKVDIEELEQIVVKLGKDKLELTEKLSHEKQLNKQLMLKLAELEETLKQMQTKLIAKDDEMIRLQANYRDIENKHETLLENLLQSKEKTVTKKIESDAEPKDNCPGDDEYNANVLNKTTSCSSDCAHKELENGNELPKEDAMYKLQERFLNIMDQVANLSDEKHRLEHIILQLQTETDTICEYVALYQQQRSLLKKRDEERSAQIKLFQMECDEVKRQLEELSGLFLKLAQDQDLSSHLQVESRHNDVARIKNLLQNLLNSSLINSKCMSLELKNFYPCSCCSGQLIDV